MGGFLFDNVAAFEPFFDETVRIVAKRGEKVTRTTCRASVMQVELDEPFGETNLSTERRRYNVAIPESGVNGWNRRFDLEIGDEITLENGLELAVTKAAIGTKGYIELEARAK